MSELYIAKVRIRVSGETFMPNETVRGLPETYIRFLLKKGFIKPAVTINESEAEEGLFETKHDGIGILQEDNEFDPDIAVDDVPEFYSEAQLGKLKSKSDIVNYAESIGLSGLDVNLHRPELIDKVLAYIEEAQQNEI